MRRHRRVFFVKADDVDWIEAEKNYALLHIGTEVAVIRTTLKSLEHNLNPKQFVRIHRFTIVNRSKVRKIVPWFNGCHIVVLDTGHQLRTIPQESMRILMEGTSIWASFATVTFIFIPYTCAGEHRESSR